ncbi:MAG TPA: hypothetical protein VMQ51_11245 [Candidatus Binatia bacterium]|nr:hypothetical protein [Candidatus Binatia bacterium]
MGNASALAGLLLLFGATSASPVNAQMATADGAYAKLSPGNAKIARALFEAQVSNTTPPPAGAPAAAAPKALTVDQIAAMKLGQGWGQVFSAMKAQGLVADKNLGQVVSRYQHRMNGGAVTTVSTRGGGIAPKDAAAEPSASYDAGR